MQAAREWSPLRRDRRSASIIMARVDEDPLPWAWAQWRLGGCSKSGLPHAVPGFPPGLAAVSRPKAGTGGAAHGGLGPTGVGRLRPEDETAGGAGTGGGVAAPRSGEPGPRTAGTAVPHSGVGWTTRGRSLLLPSHRSLPVSQKEWPLGLWRGPTPFKVGRGECFPRSRSWDTWIPSRR